MALQLDRVVRDGDGARDQSHLRTCQRGECVVVARRPRPRRPTHRRSGSDGGDRRCSGSRRRTGRRRGRRSDRSSSGRRRGVRRCVGSSGAGVAVGKASASQGICRFKPARDMLHIEAELLDVNEPARGEAVDVLLRAQPRDCLRRCQAGSVEHAQTVHHREQLEDVWWLVLLGCRQLAVLVRDGGGRHHPAV